MKIVLARTEKDFRVTGERRTDLGERPNIEEFDRPVTAMWLNDGTDHDVAKARAYASQEGYEVFTYPASEKDPLGKAKRDVMRHRHPGNTGTLVVKPEHEKPFRTTVREFIRDNEGDDWVCEQVLGLRPGQSVQLGGGAQPGMVVRRVKSRK